MGGLVNVLTFRLWLRWDCRRSPPKSGPLASGCLKRQERNEIHMKTNVGDKGLKDRAQGQHKQLERPLETGQMSNNTDTETTDEL